MLKVAESRVEKQLDLVKFIQVRRSQMYKTLMAIKPQKALILEKMGTMTINESSDLKTDSAYTDDDGFGAELTPSSSTMSKDLQDIYRLKENLVKVRDDEVVPSHKAKPVAVRHASQDAAQLSQNANNPIKENLVKMTDQSP